MFPFYRLNSKYREPYRLHIHIPFFIDFNIFLSLLEKRKPNRDQFFYKKALKTDIYALRFALKTVFTRESGF
jgi:hypothetical protein